VWQPLRKKLKACPRDPNKFNYLVQLLIKYFPSLEDQIQPFKWMLWHAFYGIHPEDATIVHQLKNDCRFELQDLSEEEIVEVDRYYRSLVDQ
jgi:hypothetical protein